MSSAEVAVQVFRELEIEDFRILNIIEAGMSKHEFVPKEQIQKHAKICAGQFLNKLWPYGGKKLFTNL